jgi:putative endonuclease
MMSGQAKRQRHNKRRSGTDCSSSAPRSSSRHSHVPRKLSGFTWLPRLDSNRVKRLRLTRSGALIIAMYYVYLLRSVTDDGFYIGYSTDLRKRLLEHKRGASFATRYRGPWKLIYYEAYIEREDAEGRERYLKSGAGRRLLHHQLRHYLQNFPIPNRV